MPTLHAWRSLPMLLASLVFLAQPVWADIDVGDADELKAAVARAEPGETIKLSPGIYDDLILRGIEGDTGQPITLTSADPSDPARISGLRVHKSKHLILEGLIFDYVFSPGDKLRMRPFQVTNSQNIGIRNAVFDGDVAKGVSPTSDGFGYAFGLSVRGSQDVHIENIEIKTFFKGLSVSNSQNVVVRNNNVHSLRMDGMNFSQVRDVRIEENRIHDFIRSPDSKDHADMIQFWTRRTTEPTENIVISDNILNSGAGLYTHSIFMRNEIVDHGKAGREMFYRNIVIEDNVVINAHLHGISIGQSDGVTIQNNSVIRNAGSQGDRNNNTLYDPRISVSPNSSHVRIANNVVSRIAGFKRQDDWDAHDNFLIQDRHPLKPGYYEAVFRNPTKGNPEDLSSFFAKDGGPLDGTNYGATRLNGAK